MTSKTSILTDFCAHKSNNTRQRNASIGYLKELELCG